VKLLKVQTTRFVQVVEAAGPPEVYILWQKPADDRHLRGLITNHRIMTILTSESGTAFGQVGFEERKGASYLAFPKSLLSFAGHRIIGINWDAVSH
jgi:hypothetical protein